jgi:hypothetical protein
MKAKANASRRLGALLFLWAAVTGGMLALTACYGENCNGSSGGYGNKPGEGRMIDENTWESSPMDGKWLHFSSGHIWFFEVPELGERTPFRVETYLSPVEDPNVFHPERAPSNFTMGGGNLAELSGVGPNRFIVRNGTCAEYFVRVVVEVPPRPDSIAPGTVGGVDASVDAGADASDAGVDSGDDSGASDAATD